MSTAMSFRTLRFIATTSLALLSLSSAFSPTSSCNRIRNIQRINVGLMNDSPSMQSSSLVTLSALLEPRRKEGSIVSNHDKLDEALVAHRDGKDAAGAPRGRWVSSIIFATVLAVSIQFAILSSSAEASSYGQFGASVSPPKTAISIAEQSGKAQTKVKGVATCLPVSAISSFNSNLGRCKETSAMTTTGDEHLSDQEVEHQRLVENLSQEPEWFNYVAAFSASCISTLIIHPLDTIKVRLMTKNDENESNDFLDHGNEDLFVSSASVDIDIHQPNMANTSIRTTSQNASRESSTALAAAAVDTDPIPSFSRRTQGILNDFGSLYSGIVPNIVKEGPPSALYLGLYESSIIFLKQYPFFTDNKLIMYLLAGAIGELVGSVVRAPAESVKTRVQTGGSSVMEAVKTVFLSEEGRRNTFRAWSSSIFRDVPAGAIQIAIFETLKLVLITTPYVNVDTDNVFSESLLGGIGGAFGAFLTTPSDRITTLIISSEDDVSMFDGAKAIWNDQGGVKGFFLGSGERSSYWFFAVGIFLSVYCALRQAAIPLFVN